MAEGPLILIELKEPLHCVQYGASGEFSDVYSCVPRHPKSFASSDIQVPI